MLTKFFSTTKPAAVIAVLLYMTLGYFYANRALFTEPFDWLSILKNFWMLAMFILAMFILNFIVQKNDLTKRSSYKIILFAAFGVALPAALTDYKILLSGLIILIALRRIISFRSGNNMERKIFDATFWICLATLPFFYSWVFIIALYLALLLYANLNVRYLFIPLLAIGAFGMLLYCYALQFTGGTLAFYFEAISFDFSPYNSLHILAVIAFFIGITLWTIWSYIGELNRSSTAYRSRYSVILSILAVSIVLVLFTSNKNGGEWYFVIPILAIIVTFYLEHTTSLIFKESLLWLTILLPFVIAFL